MRNIPIVGEAPAVIPGRPLIRIEIRTSHDGGFISEIQIAAHKNGQSGFEKSVLKPELTPDTAIVSAHLHILRKLSKPPEEPSPILQ